MKKLLILVTLLLSACSQPQVTQQKSAKTLLVVKETIINTHELFRVPCKTGAVKKETCQEVDNLTTKAKVAYDVAADAAVLALQTGDTTNAQEKMNALLNLQMDLVKLSQQAGLLKQQK
jgi:hypothetical protein